MKALLLANPTARGGAGARAAENAAARLRRHGVAVSVISATGARQAQRLLQEALRRPPDAVIAVGGDGTAAVAVQVLAGTEVPLGIVAVGTGNDFATALGLPLRNVDAAVGAVAAAMARSAPARRVDLARVSDAQGRARLFATVLATGFDARVNDRANAMRWPRGPARYTLAILIEFARLRGIAYQLELTGADGTTHRLSTDLVLAAVGNGPRYGGGIPICPDAVLDDGMLDVTVVHAAGRAHLLRLLPRLYRGTHTSLDEVSTYRVRRVRLEAAEADGYADGDSVGALPLEVEVVPGALCVLS